MPKPAPETPAAPSADVSDVPPSHAREDLVEVIEVQGEWIELDPPTPVQWPRPWMEEFLAVLSTIPNVTAAAQASGISARHANRVRAKNPAFKQACIDALAQSYEHLKRYAWQLATTGVTSVTTVTRVKIKNGVEVERETITTNGRVISPAMTATLLRAHDPLQYGRDPKPQHDELPDAPPEIYRMPDQARALELARISLELEAGPAPTEHPDVEG